MAIIKTRNRRGTTWTWTRNNPILDAGEIGLEAETANSDGSLTIKTNQETGEPMPLMKIGDGQTPWNDLPYAVAPVYGQSWLPWAVAVNATRQTNTLIRRAMEKFEELMSPEYSRPLWNTAINGVRLTNSAIQQAMQLFKL